MSHGTGEAATRRDGRGAPVSALAGGLVSFVTIFLPFAPVVGGAIAGLVFDVPHRPRFRHYLAWDHPTPVAGVEGVVFLWPGGG